MMKTKFIILPILILCTLAAAEYDVVGLKLYLDGDYTVTEAITSGPAEIRTVKFENPDRLVIDLIGGVHRLKDTDLPPLPPGVVVEVRSAQFQGKPNPITRIVLVLAEPVGEVKTENSPRSGKILIPTPGYPEFEIWSIGQETLAKAAKTEHAAPQKVETEKVSAEPVEKVVEPIPKPVEKAPVETIAEKEEKPSYEPEFQTAFIAGDSTGKGTTYVRPLVVYRGWDNPDPFIVAKPATESTLGEEAFPIVEDLNFVGIVTGEKSSELAVLQDARGWGYILGVGDSIKGGLVSSVSDTTITFDIEEFGIIRQVTLELSKEVSN